MNELDLSLIFEYPNEVGPVCRIAFDVGNRDPQKA